VSDVTGPLDRVPGGSLRIRATLEPRGPAGAVVLTDEQVAVIGAGAKTPPVRVTVNGHTFSGRIGRMGGESLLGFSRAVREAAGVTLGQELELEIVLDATPREVEPPAALAAAFERDRVARDAFDELAHSHRKEFVRWVAEAKRPDTRERRVAKTLQMLHDGQTRR
jgi:Bacteriocin-protection, YdeI or OmpD-Associated/Domain of unknown function (DUF1905)